MSFLPRLSLLFALLIIVSCGDHGTPTGGAPGTGTTISGVAAAGAPLAGQVFLVDTHGATPAISPITVGSDGSFSFDISGLTAPFVLKATGTPAGSGNTVIMFSAATGPGITNVNPMTNVAVAAATGVNDPSLVFASPQGFASRITNASLQTAISSVQAMLAPILSAANATGINPLTDQFTANHTGLDAVFDQVRLQINTSTGTVTVTDTTGAFLGSAPVSQMGLTPVTTLPKPVVTGVVATAGNGQVSLRWNAVAGAVSFNIFFSTTSGVTTTNGTRVTTPTNSQIITGLVNGTTYFFIVTAVTSAGESAPSTQVSATPTAPGTTTTTTGTPTTSTTPTVSPIVPSVSPMTPTNPTNQVPTTPSTGTSGQSM